MSRLTAAYVAGLIDGEGCIYINPHKGKNYTYATVVTVGMTAKALAILKALHSQYGGWTGQTRAATVRWDAAHAWSITGPAAAKVLREIQDHLILKDEQARLAIRLEDIKASLPRRPNGTAAWTDHVRNHCRTIHLRIQELNAKGPAVREAPATIAGRWPIARHVAGQWVTDQGDLFSDTGWASFKGPWPTSGSMRNGRLYPPPTSGHRTGGSGSSSSRGLLPTPQEFDSHFDEVNISPEAAERQLRRTDGYQRSTTGSLTKDLLMLRTPTAQLAANGGSQHPDKRKAGGHGPTLADEVEHLLPTPNATDGNGGPRAVPEKRTSRGKDHGPRLRDVAPVLLPTPSVADATGGHKTRSGDRSGEPLLGGIAMLLPTPAAHDSANTPENHLRKKPGRSQVTSLQVIVDYGLPTGGRTDPLSPAGKPSSDGPRHVQPSLDAPESD